MLQGNTSKEIIMKIVSTSSLRPRALTLSMILGACAFGGTMLATSAMASRVAINPGATIQGCTTTCGWSQSQGWHCEITCTLPF